MEKEQILDYFEKIGVYNKECTRDSVEDMIDELTDTVREEALEKKYHKDWIPFAEKQPTDGAHVLITVKYSDHDYEVMESDWGVLKYAVKHGTATEVGKEIYEKAIAWMPMPFPYKEH